MVRLALVTTVRNERALLRDNLRYHRWLGVERCYVFLDGSTDGTGDSLGDLPGVVLAPSAQPGQLAASVAATPAAQRFLPRLATHPTARQMLNSAVATAEARAEGFDWLVSLDPDELLCPDTGRLGPGDLGRLLAELPPDLDALTFLPLEVIPSLAPGTGLPFRDATRFKNRFAPVEGRFEAVHAFPRRIADPLGGGAFTTRDYLGHTRGKTAIRTDRDLVPGSVHSFRTPADSRPREGAAGWLLHYCNATFEGFLTRYRHRRDYPETYANGTPVDPLDRLFESLVNGGHLTLAQLRDYFLAQIVPSERDVAAWRGLNPASVVEVPAVRDAFRQLPGESGGLSLP